MTVTVDSRIAPVRSGTPEAADGARTGGKGAGLARLEALGLPVPPWFAVPPEALAASLEAAGESAGAGAATPETVGSLPLPEELAASLAAARREHLGEADGVWLAVRSSAVDEDAAGASFAGIHDTVFLPPGGDLADAVRRVWASGFSPRAVEYRRRLGLPLGAVAMAVVVQRVVEPRSSGVLFTVDPMAPTPDILRLSAVPGAGEGLVGGDFAADVFRLTGTDHDAEVDLTPADHREYLVLDAAAAGGLRRAALPAERVGRPALSVAEALEVARGGRLVADDAGQPQDVEFVFDRDDRLWFLQSRPITVTAPPVAVEALADAAPDGRRRTWESGAVAESWSGVAAPMTLAFVRRTSAIVHRCFAGVMGIDDETVRRHQPVFDDGIGFLGGRVYLNSDHRYRMLRLVPGVGFAPGKLLPLLGAKLRPDLETEFPAPGPRHLPALAGTVARVGRALWGVRREVAGFLERFDRQVTRVEGASFEERSPEELLDLYRDVEGRLLWQWRAPIVNGFFTSVNYGLLGLLGRRWLGDTTGELRNRLLTGEGGIDSTEPTRRLLELTETARRDPELRRVLLSDDPARSLEGDAFTEFAEAFAGYVDRFHFRCRRELNLEEPSLKRAPGFALGMIANYLRLDDPEGDRRPDPQGDAERERKIRADAEAEVRSRLGFARRLVFRRVLANARLGMKNRENIRFARIRMFGLARELAWALGDHLAADGVLADPEDVFFLTLDEIADFVGGTAVVTDLAGLVELRRRQQRAYETAPAPDETVETHGPVYRNRFHGEGDDAADDDGRSLRGVGCSPGRATGPAKVVREHSPDLRLDGGEVLAVQRVNPSLVPLYPSLAGLLVEQGDALSHSVIVAREMGLPTVVNLPGLTRRLEDGLSVTLDGATGHVTWEERENP